MDKLGQTSCTNPYAIALVANRKKRPIAIGGTAPMAMLGDRVDRLRRLAFVDRLLAELISLTLGNGKRAHRAGPKAEARAIAKLFLYNFCLTVNDLNSAFNTGAHTETAAVTSLFIDLNDLPERFCSHDCLLLCMWHK